MKYNRCVRRLCALLLASLLPLAAAVAADSDGDGIDDLRDCAPDDHRIAFPQRYYFDLDGDQYGDPGNSVTICSLQPFPGTVAWANDPDDNDANVFPTPVAAGARVFGLHVNDTGASGQWRPERLQTLGVQAGNVTLSWAAIETAPGRFDGPQSGLLSLFRDTYRAAGLQLSLAIGPLIDGQLDLPDDLAQQIADGSLNFSSPQFIQRFNALLDFIHTSLGDLPVIHLQFGQLVDSDITQHPTPRFWQDYAAFLSASRLHARQRWSARPPVVGVTTDLEILLNSDTRLLLAPLQQASDIIDVRYQPRQTDFSTVDETRIRADIEGVIAAYYPKAIALQSLAFSSAPQLASSTTHQAQLLSAFFDIWDQYASLMPYVALKQLVDSPPPTSPALRPEAFATSLGLIEYALPETPKTAYKTLLNRLYERGWRQQAAPSRRNFLMGFTAFPYDQIPAAAAPPPALDQTFAISNAHGDLISLQFDKGVPWTEALNDDFSSPTPPYSPQLLSTWQSYKDRLPGSGKSLAIAINPLGIPRDRLAAYWGPGESYILDARQQAIGTGVFLDYEDRLLPPPWDGYRLDSPAVRTAYLNYVKRVIDYFQPRYLEIGREVNLALSKPAVFSAYLDLQRYIYQQLRADPAYDQVRIVVSVAGEYFMRDEFGVPLLVDAIQDPTLSQRHADALQALAPYTDVIGLAIYPAKTRYAANGMPASVIRDLFVHLRQLTDKPLAISETGFPASGFQSTAWQRTFNGSETKQADYLNLLLATMNGVNGIEFINQFAPTDLTPYMDRLRQSALQQPPYISAALVDFFQLFEFNGLFAIDGSARTAGALWQRFLTLPLQSIPQRSSSARLSSPDGLLEADFSIDSSGHLSYRLKRQGITVIKDSPLGITVDGRDLGGNALSLTASAGSRQTTAYPLLGHHNRARNDYLGYELHIDRLGPVDTRLDLIVRLYDDGLALRYRIPGNAPAERRIGGESTAWTLPAGSEFWYNSNTGNYEGFYHHSRSGQLGASFSGPVTAKLGNGAGYLLISEADLDNFSGLTFRSRLGDHRLRAEFLDDREWLVTAGAYSPWRLLISTADLQGLVNSDLVGNLSPDADPSLFPAGPRTSWIRPGRAVWSWWSDFYSGFDFERQKQYVDYARRLGFEYSLVDAWWEQGFPVNGQTQFQRLAELVDYAAQGTPPVAIWVWKNWYELVDPQQRQAFMQAVSDAGAAGIKIDNLSSADSESQLGVRLQEEILREAARWQLMVNFHGLNKPTGLQHRYPNEITREALLGLELNSLAATFPQAGIPFQGATAAHNATLPFTRMVVGPGDYTPLTLDPARTAGTTFAHQLATLGIMTSPLQHLAADPARVIAASNISDIVRDMPTTWDETVILPGSEIGRLVLMARRKDNDWYLFGLNGDDQQPRSIARLDLSFLGDHRFRADIISDATATSFQRQQIASVRNDQILPITLLAGGGFVIRFTPAAPPARSFRMGFSNLPTRNDSSGWSDTFSRIANHGDLISHSLQDGIPWSEALLSDRISDYPVDMQQFWGLLKSADQSLPPTTARYLMINPIATNYLGLAPYWNERGKNQPLPAPWDQLPFNDQRVKKAYVNYLVAAVEYFQPQFLAINIEANILLAKRPDLWPAFKELNAYAYQAIKQRYPGLTVFSTIHYEHMLGLHSESADFARATRDSYPDALQNEVRQLLQHSDLMALSTYPFMVADNPYLNNGRPTTDYYQTAYRIASEQGLPLAIDQTGHISQDLFHRPSQATLSGTEEQQRNFITFLLAEAAAHDFAFVSYFVAQDYGLNYGSDPTTLTWAYTGLFTQNGQPKQALASWDQVYSQPLQTNASSGNPPQGIRLAGDVQYVWHDQQQIFLVLENGFIARIDLLDEDIARIRINADGKLTDWLSGAIALNGIHAPASSQISLDANSITATTTGYRLRIERHPFRIVSERPDGSLISSDLIDGIGFDDRRQTVFNGKLAPAGERYLGLGLRGGPLDRRGQIMVMRNTDHFGYGEFTGPLYSSTPFVYGENNGRFYGLFVDSPAEPYFDLDSGANGQLQIGANQAELDYYLISGPTTDQVANGYARLTGHVPLPPLWALGFHQSRYGYASWAEIRQVADTFRNLQIPVDAVYLDLDYMNQLDWFSWNPLTFADPIGNNAYLERLGIKRVNILDPSIQPDDPVYPFLAQSHFFLEDASGQPVLGNIFLPFGDVSWFDYTNPAAGQFYIDRLKTFLQTGISGIWNDINEPASNYMPQAIYDFGGQKRSDKQARNLYALSNVRLTRQAMLELRPDERPFILARSGYAGSQRYNANWSGDSLSTFDSLRVSIQNSLHMSLSGMLLFGHDIGGFLGTPDPELFARWFQFASFNPYFRNHAVNTSGSSEPWVYGEPYTSIIRDAINERYRLLPYFYTLMEDASRTARPILAPLFYHFPDDPQSYQQDDQFLIGDSLLVAPVHTAGARQRQLYLPAGSDWYEQNSDQRYTGGQTITVAAPLSSIPVFVRAGAIIPRQAVRQYVSEPAADMTFLDIYPGNDRRQEIYEDDGISYGFRQGDFLRTAITTSQQPSGDLLLTIRHVDGNRHRLQQGWRIQLHDQAPPVRLLLDGSSIPAVATAAELAANPQASWFYDPRQRTLTIHARRDTRQTLTVLIEQGGVATFPSPPNGP